MERLKVVEFKALLKSLGLRGYSRLRKVELVKLIMDHLSSRPRPIPRPHQVLGHHPHLHQDLSHHPDHQYFKDINLGRKDMQ